MTTKNIVIKPVYQLRWPVKTEMRYYIREKPMECFPIPRNQEAVNQLGQFFNRDEDRIAAYYQMVFNDRYAQ